MEQFNYFNYINIIVKLFEEEIKLFDLFYEIRGLVCYPASNHFTCYIINKIVDMEDNLLDIIRNNFSYLYIFKN
jgi:hypothetical protein